MNITIVLGTARQGRNSERVYVALQQFFLHKENMEVTSVDIKDHVTLPETIPNWGEPVWETGARLAENFFEQSERKGPASGQHRYDENGVDGARMYSRWKKIVKKTDTFIFILPEYNHSFPGEWKLLVDSLYKEYSGKKAYVVGVSGGVFSGVRVSDHVKHVLIELNFNVQKLGLQIGNVKDAISQDGEVLDGALSERIQKFVDQVTEEA